MTSLRPQLLKILHHDPNTKKKGKAAKSGELREFPGVARIYGDNRRIARISANFIRFWSSCRNSCNLDCAGTYMYSHFGSSFRDGEEKRGSRRQIGRGHPHTCNCPMLCATARAKRGVEGGSPTAAQSIGGGASCPACREREGGSAGGCCFCCLFLGRFIWVAHLSGNLGHVSRGPLRALRLHLANHCGDRALRSAPLVNFLSVYVKAIGLFCLFCLRHLRLLPGPGLRLQLHSASSTNLI